MQIFAEILAQGCSSWVATENKEKEWNEQKEVKEPI